MLTPATELTKLNYFEGTWRLEGEIKASPMSSGAGRLTETDHNEWMDGGFFLIVRSEFTISGIQRATGVAYLGYDPNEKAYTYDEFNSMGDAIHSKGSLDGDTWRWIGERKTDDKTTKTRWVVTMTSDTSYDFKFELSPEGGNWSTVVEGKAAKQK